MGVACSLLILAITASWALEGRVGYRLRSFGSEQTGDVRGEESPMLFWLVVGGSLAAGIAGVAVTSVGLARVQREEEPILEGSDSPQRESGPRLNKP
jgi:hypothetical protein